MKALKSMAYGTGLALAMTGAAFAADSAAGTWSVNIAGDSGACEITLHADANTDAGTAQPAADCSARAQQIGRWSDAGGKLTLKKASGETIAILMPKDNGYSGKRFADYRKVTLTPESGTVAQSR